MSIIFLLLVFFASIWATIVIPYFLGAAIGMGFEEIGKRLNDKIDE